MRILVDSGTYDCLNMGDVAMLQATVERLNSLWPKAVIRVLTDDPGRLAIHCPGTFPVPASGKRLWFADRILLGRLHKGLPVPVSQLLIRMKRKVRLEAPGFIRRAIELKLRLNGARGRDLLAFLRAVFQADLVIVAGQAALNDFSPIYATGLIGLLEMAMKSGIPVALMGQGLGPLEDPGLLAYSRKVLPNVPLIAIRERKYGSPLLASLGVPDRNLLVTGDDAIEAAYRQRSDVPGQGIGVSMRSTKASGVGPEMLDQLRPVIQASAAQHNAPLVGLPVALHNTGTYDPESIQQIFAGYTGQSDSGRNLSTPAELIRRIGECRVVVTGAYHPAVFALAQGIPAVCLSQSRYSTIKFQGLRDLFGSGCELVMLDRPDFGVKIQAVIRHAWEAAEHWRPSLLQAAERQILASHAAYQQLTRIAGGSRVRPDHIEAESEVPVPERVLQGVA